MPAGRCCRVPALCLSPGGHVEGDPPGYDVSVNCKGEESMEQPLTTSSGVEKLIARLRDEGVKAGEEKARKVLEDAEKRASEITARASSEAEALLAKARAEIEADRSASKEALQIALRDTVIELKERMTNRFSARIRQLVAKELTDVGVLKELILSIAGRATPERNQAIQILLSDQWFAEIPDKAASGQKSAVDSLIVSVGRDILREGVTFAPSGDSTPGLRVRMEGQNVEIDLSDKTLATLILKHLVPRFRDLVEGVVH